MIVWGEVWSEKRILILLFSLFLFPNRDYPYLLLARVRLPPPFYKEIQTAPYYPSMAIEAAVNAFSLYLALSLRHYLSKFLWFPFTLSTSS